MNQTAPGYRARHVLEGLQVKASLWLPIGVFVLDGSMTAGSFVGALMVSIVAVKALLGLLLGVAIARLFLLGHDACHGSFTRHRKLNGIIGRLAFLPSLTPFGPWSLAHNQHHHAFTNVKGWDYVWAPLSYDEWSALSNTRRLLERCYRTPFGHGLHYVLEIWLKHLILPLPETRKRWMTSYWNDLYLVFGFAICTIACVFVAANVRHQNVVVEFFCAVLLPFAIWNALMGFVIYQHHTAPDIVWVSSIAEQMQQTTVTAHVAFPRFLNFLFHNIMDHPAHHIDPLIPFYSLRQAEAALIKAFPDQIHHRRFTISRFFQTVKQCKLYDYENRRWLDFDGNFRPSCQWSEGAIYATDNCEGWVV